MRTLVIVAMQHDFISGALANPAAAKIVPGIVDLVKSNLYDRIICTLDTHSADYLTTVEGQNLPVPHCIRMTNGWLLNEEIRKAVEEFGQKSFNSVIYLEKNTFGSTQLAYEACEDEFDSVDFVGTCTGICVINNVALVKARHPDATITVYEDLCACVTPESHNRAIEQMKFNHINIDTWSE